MPDANTGPVNYRSKSSPDENTPAAVNQVSGKPVARWGRRVRLLAAERDFRVFFAGYSTSLLGTAMSRIALTFAVLDSGGTASDLGVVFAASVFPQVLVMLGGGVLADRIGRRPLMLVTDAARLAVQAMLATVLFTGRPSLWLFMSLSALLSVGEGFFYPALSGLRAEMAPPTACRTRMPCSAWPARQRPSPAPHWPAY